MARQSNTVHDENRREKNLRDEMFIMNIEYIPREQNNYWVEKSVILTKTTGSKIPTTISVYYVGTRILSAFSKYKKT